MKKAIVLFLLTIMPLTMTACGNSRQSSGVYTNSEDYGSVVLGEYKNLSAEKKVYEISEEDIQGELEYMMYDYVTYNEVDRVSEDGDILSVAMTASKDGEVLVESTEDETYEIYLGYEEFGTEFDQKLTGVEKGAELSFELSYPEDSDWIEFAGATIQYEVKVLSITEEVYPELNEEFIVETLGYESEEALKAQLKADLESSYESESVYELQETLLQQVIDSSTYNEYSEELYESYAQSIEESYASYAEMFGCETTEEVYELFGLTEEDVAEETLNAVYRTITVLKIAEEENLKISDEEYEEALEVYTEELGYESSDELVEDYGEESIQIWLMEEKVLSFLVENAQIAEVVTAITEE